MQTIIATNDSTVRHGLSHHVVPKLLDWPFLLFVTLLVFLMYFRKELKAVFTRGDIMIKWGEGSIQLKELSSNLDKEFDPVREQIASLKAALASATSTSASPVGAPAVHALTATQHDAVRGRLLDALTTSEYKWRSLERLAEIAGVSQPTVLDILRTMPEVELSVGKSNRQIAGLTKRVRGPNPDAPR